MTTELGARGTVVDMIFETSTRTAARAAAVAALIGIPADLYHFMIPGRAEVADTVLFKVHGILLILAFSVAIVALAAIARQLGTNSGRLGTTAVLLAFLGTVLVIGNISTEAFWMPQAPDVIDEPTGFTLATIVVSFGIFSLGWLLVGVTVLRRGLVEAPTAGLLCFGAFVGFTPLPGAYILLLAGIAAVMHQLAAGPGGVTDDEDLLSARSRWEDDAQRVEAAPVG